MSKVILGYWDIRGLAQPIRMLLEYTGTPYEDKRYEVKGSSGNWDLSSWFNDKFNLGLDFPNLPYLIDGEIKITQSNAILRHIGRKNNLCGTNETEMALADLVIYEVVDFRDKFVSLCYNPDFANQEPKYLEGLPAKLTKFENYLKGKQWAAGANLTIADFLLYEMMDQHLVLQPSCLDKFPLLKDHHSRFAALPKIAEYKKSDRFLDRPFNNKMASFK